MVAHEVIFVPREGRLNQAVLCLQFSQFAEYLSIQMTDSWRFAIVWKVQHMDHILRFLLLHKIPALFG